MVQSILGMLPPGLGCVKGVEYEIKVRETRPIKQRHYPMSDKEQDEMLKRKCCGKGSSSRRKAVGQTQS